MATDVTPCRSTIDLENLKFAVNSNGEIVIRVEDEESVDVLNDILVALGGSSGTPIFDESFNTASPGTGSTVNLITTSVGVGLTRTFVSMKCTSRVPGRFELKLGGTLIGVRETGSGQYNSDLVFDVKKTGAAGTSVTVDFVQLRGPAAAPVSVSLMSTEI